MKIIVGCVLVALCALPASSGAQDPPPLLGVNVDAGVIDLGMLAPVDSKVTFREIVGGAPTELGTAISVNPKGGAIGGATLYPSVPWRCDRLVRYFTATAVTPDDKTIEASNEARTPSCRNRIAVTLPQQVERGRSVRVQIRDRWQQGDIGVRACLRRPGGLRTCRGLVFAIGQKSGVVRLKAGNQKAVVDIDVTINGTKFHNHNKVGVGMPKPKSSLPKMLVTGDSMIQGIDALLAEKLSSRYKVIRQTRPGTGISKKLGTPWTSLARQQVRNHKPVVSVVFLGGNDAYDMQTPAGTTVKCCDDAWRQEYLRRLADMAATYAQGERGRVIWCLIPPPRRADMLTATQAVNSQILLLSQIVPTITLVRLDQVFGPTYRETVRGKQVRDPDGLHLSLAGERIAADEIIKAERGATAASR